MIFNKQQKEALGELLKDVSDTELKKLFNSYSDPKKIRSDHAHLMDAEKAKLVKAEIESRANPPQRTGVAKGASLEAIKKKYRDFD